MNSVYFDIPIQEAARRKQLYEGQLFVYSPTPSSKALCEFAQQLSAEAFAPHDPKMAQLDPQVRLICPIGGIILFSGAHMHSTVPNDSGYTRFSIDFRTVNADDVASGTGAPNIDSECTGTSMRDCLSGSDFPRLSEELIRPYDTEPVLEDAMLVYEASKKG
jgi:hypothetical protein